MISVTQLTENLRVNVALRIKKNSNFKNQIPMQQYKFSHYQDRHGSHLQLFPYIYNTRVQVDPGVTDPDSFGTIHSAIFTESENNEHLATETNILDM